MTVPYTGSTALQPSAPNCEPPECRERGNLVRSRRPRPRCPRSSARFAAGRPVRAVWANELGGITFRVGLGLCGAEFIKVARRRAAQVGDFAEEARRLRWAARYVAVPQVLGRRPCRTTALRLAAHPRAARPVRGTPRWLAAPDVAVRAIGAGLRTLHDRLPVPSCPFDWSATRTAGLADAGTRARLGEPPPVDRLVVCHGDAVLARTR